MKKAEIPVYGPVIDSQTRCIHYHGPLDVIAIKFKCCKKYYPCHLCHTECESHPLERWTPAEFHEKAILCGVCGKELSIAEYLEVSSCPFCGAQFNPGCKTHLHYYFEIPAGSGNENTLCNPKS